MLGVDDKSHTGEVVRTREKRQSEKTRAVDDEHKHLPKPEDSKHGTCPTIAVKCLFKAFLTDIGGCMCSEAKRSVSTNKKLRNTAVGADCAAAGPHSETAKRTLNQSHTDGRIPQH